MKMINLAKKVLPFVLLVVTFVACVKDEEEFFPETQFYALAEGGKLDKLSTKNSSYMNSVSITGLQSGETILAIDFRPATGQLYGISSGSRLYVINPETGAARMIGAGPLSTLLSGTLVGFDFNPTVDRIRLVTNTGQNLRLNPETGTVAAVDGNISGETTMIAAAAYTNNTAGAATTTLYDIDVTTKKLFRQNPPNNGTLEEVGSLGINITGETGFDITTMNGMNTALAIGKVNNKATLFTIDLNTGKAKVLAKYDKNYIGIAIPTSQVFYAVDASNNFITYNAKSLSSITKPITGLAAGENVLGIDFRPANGQIYALGSTSRLYTLNASSGLATVVGVPFTTTLSGTEFGFDFNPTVDRIRVVSNTGQNLRLNPNDGTVAAVDAPLNPGMPAVTGAAYTNNFAGATSTTLFDIDTNMDKLYRQDPPNAGTLVEVGSLGVNVEAANGFDIGSTSGRAFAVLTSGGSAKLYDINITTGAVTALSGFPTAVRGFTIGLGF